MFFVEIQNSEFFNFLLHHQDIFREDNIINKIKIVKIIKIRFCIVERREQN